ncbi:AarF/UbiB family protein [Luteolibacter sp. SL250]|uniref:AarF/UbiB family protein n=1 Tax=Luteolibacter sp. SL250 TaxID=2995170 RepID=UPI00226E04FF|nr:AarF/UbiB family protein [Luteolibacter sp. SL250]WAC20772.1 AarF/UbiB family protein [Luteolibacter sp. SL250]
MNSTATPFDRHKRITLLFLKHAPLRNAPPDERAAKALADDLENLGAPFARACRLLALRGDLLPPEILGAFAKLDESRCRDEDGEAESMEVIDKVLEDEIGKKALRAFASFHPVPHRFSGAGQVHLATLHDGRRVSVRVQRPKARQRIVRDLDTLAEIAAFIDDPSGRGGLHRFSRFVDRLRITTLRELDYRHEETSLQELREKLNGYSRLRVPLPVPEFCSGRVLTTESIDGTEVWETPPRSTGHSRDLAEQLLGGYLDQIVVHGLVHPQPHLENLLLTGDGELVITEAGGTLKLGSATRPVFCFLLHALCSRDPQAVREASLRLGRPHGDDTVPDAAAFSAAITEALAEENLKERLRAVAKASATAGRPFPMAICRIADLFGNLRMSAEAIHPHFDTERFIAAHIAEQMEQIRENTVPFHSTSAA